MTFDNDQAFGLQPEIAKELNVKTFLQNPINLKIKALLKIEMVLSAGFIQRKQISKK